MALPNLEFLKDIVVLNNDLTHWIAALALTLAVLAILRIVRGAGARRIARLASRAGAGWGETLVVVLGKTKWLFLFVIAAAAGATVLELSDYTRTVVHTAVVIALLVQGGIWLGAASTEALEQFRRRRFEKDPASVTTLNAVNFITKLVLWSVVVLLVLDNLGVNVTALIAGLGVGGVAVALAVQNVLGDLLASLSIVLDKPFAVGDFLIVDDLLGSVEYVGLKTTRLRSLSGEQLVFSNNDLLSSRIRNYGRMYERRVVFKLGVTYQTPREKLKKIPDIIRAAIEAQEQTRFDRSHFFEYGGFSLNFETVYYVLTPDYNVYMDIQQAVNFAIHEGFEREGIEFAYPTQTLFLQKTAE